MWYRIEGIPAPKGSYRPVRNKRTGHTLFLPASKREPAWRKAVRDTIKASNPTMIPKPVPVSVRVDFYLPRPKTVKRQYPTVPPDVDKLLRSTLDGVTESGIIEDDAQIIEAYTRKMYATNGFTGCILSIQRLSVSSDSV